MGDPILNFSIDDIMKVIGIVLNAFKKVMAWLGILILPEDGEYDYPGKGTSSDGN